MEDYTQDINDVKKYYADLLILQYHSKPKARNTIMLGADIYMADGLIFQLQDILDIDTAIGAQLDLIGKILGCPRNVQGLLIDKKYFSFQKENALGFSTKNALSDGMFKTYYNSTMSVYSLLDEDYRTLLKFKAIANIERASMKDMDDALYNSFGADVVLKNNQNLTITYIVADKLNIPLLAAIKQGYLKSPIGIGFGYILEVPMPTKIFGFNKNGVIGNAVSFSTKNVLRDGTFLSKNNLISISGIKN